VSRYWSFSQPNPSFFGFTCSWWSYKHPSPATKSTPTKCSLRSSDKGITHLTHGMHSYHALFLLSIANTWMLIIGWLLNYDCVMLAITYQ
jgi:hypothetical protein